VYLDTGNDFERQLIVDGFQEEIKACILGFDEYSNEQHRAAREPARKHEVSSYSDNDLYNIITNEKTKYGPAVAERIIEGEKDFLAKGIGQMAQIKFMIDVDAVRI